MDLGGTWRAAPADEGLRRAYPHPGFDDSSWASLEVPGHWRSTPGLEGQDGPVLYRRRFEEHADRAARVPPGTRSWLVLDGVFYQSDVWLDGSYLGDTEGYFFPHAFEVTDDLRARREHVLGIEVTCAPQTDRTAKRNITGVFQHWDCLDPDWNPGGIWRPVRIEHSGPVRIQRVRVLCSHATSDRAELTIRAVLDAAEATGVDLVTTATLHGSADGGTEHRQRQTLSAGENRLRWQVTIDRPALWWPHALGEQALYDVTVEVLAPPSSPSGSPSGVLSRSAPRRPGATQQGRVSSDRRTVRTGLRSMRMRRWVMTVNGERLFLKGSNHGPTRMALGEATADELEGDVLAAKQAGLDLLRLHAHITRPELYQAADRHGMLVWQDLPLQWGYARGIRRQAVRQAAEAVDLLGHHPSIAIWCGHNEPLALDLMTGGPGSGAAGGPATTGAATTGAAGRAATGAAGRNADAAFRRVMAQFLVGQELPSWNKTVLDGSVRRALERADPTRAVVPHSGVLPHPGSMGTDTHVYFGWYHGSERQFPGFCAAWPRLARFVSEFGAQAVPEAAGFMRPERWPDLDWPRLAHTHGLQKAVFEQQGLAPEHFPTFEAWREATQRYQATLLKHHIETLRRLKYRPTGGFCQFALADGHPAVTWSVLDVERRPKAGYAALTQACAPVIVVADRLPDPLVPGSELALDVHVVSDLRVDIVGARVSATLELPGSPTSAWAWQGDVPADACVRIGTISFVVPRGPDPGTGPRPDCTCEAVLELSLLAPGAKAENRYTSAMPAISTTA